MPELEYKTRGVYFSHATVALLDLDLGDLQECRDRLGIDRPSLYERYHGWSFKDDTTFGLGDITPLLVHQHERYHYIQLMSTPMGVLIWRTTNAQLTGVNFLTRYLQQSRAAKVVYLPIQDWFLRDGQVELRRSPPKIPTHLKNAGWAVPQLLTALAMAVDEIKTLGLFLDCILGRMSLSMRQFVDLANRAFRSLGERSDLYVEATWTARDLDAKSYLPTGGFSTTEMIEAAARMGERLMLQAANATEDTIGQWHNTSIFGVYKPAYDWLWHELHEPWAALLAVDLSLLTPIDLGCGSAVQGRYVVEDVLPAWRLSRIVASMKKSFWSSDPIRQHDDALEGIVERAGLPTPRAVLESALGAPLTGERSWGADARLLGVENGASSLECFEYTESEIRRAFGERLADALAFVPVPGRTKPPTVFQPALEIFRDTVFCHLSPTTKASEGIHVKFYWHLLLCHGGMALLRDGDVSLLERIQASFLRRYPELSSELNPGLWDARQILKNGFGEDLFELLKWTSKS